MFICVFSSVSSLFDSGSVLLLVLSGMEMLSVHTWNQHCSHFRNVSLQFIGICKHICLLLAVDCKDVSLVVDCESLVSFDWELKGCWELLLGPLDVRELDTDDGNGLSASI